ncbi:MAG TPA: hypothetical protein DCY20_05980 [Firmicutes bacterium]|nr:hypothetical protein [Bacillota bacterium]
MSYKNGSELLPASLILQIQEYIDGETIYIPRKEINRKKWGECTETKSFMNKRNQAIYHKYQRGVSVRSLSSEYHISTQAIYKIISKCKASS